MEGATTCRPTTPARRSACRRRPDDHVRLRPGAVPRRRRARDRFGLADRQPAALVTLPHFPADDLDPARRRRPCVQACADDPQVAVHAIRNLARIGFGTAAMRWSQLGLRPHVVDVHRQRRRATCSASRTAPPTSRPRRPTDLDEHVWVAAGDDPAADWLAGGSYLVARRISMTHRDLGPHAAARAGGVRRPHQGHGRPAVGRRRVQPSPTSPSRAARRAAHRRDSHVRLAHPTQNGGARMLRRGYNFTDGNDGLGRLDAGLFFLAFVRDPRTHYIPMQNRDAARRRADGVPRSPARRSSPSRPGIGGASTSARRCSPDSALATRLPGGLT